MYHNPTALTVCQGIRLRFAESSLMPQSVIGSFKQAGFLLGIYCVLFVVVVAVGFSVHVHWANFGCCNLYSISVFGFGFAEATAARLTGFVVDRSVVLLR